MQHVYLCIVERWTFLAHIKKMLLRLLIHSNGWFCCRVCSYKYFVHWKGNYRVICNFNCKIRARWQRYHVKWFFRSKFYDSSFEVFSNIADGCTHAHFGVYSLMQEKDSWRNGEAHANTWMTIDTPFFYMESCNFTFQNGQ